MELNITLVMQAINFLCAYLVMRYGLFSHAVACAKADKEYTDSLVSAICDRKIIIEQKRLEKEESWKTCQYKLAKNEPSPQLIQIVTRVSSTPAMQIPTISDDALAQAIAQSVAAIKKIGDLS